MMAKIRKRRQDYGMEWFILFCSAILFGIIFVCALGFVFLSDLPHYPLYMVIVGAITLALSATAGACKLAKIKHPTTTWKSAPLLILVIAAIVLIVLFSLNGWRQAEKDSTDYLSPSTQLSLNRLAVQDSLIQIHEKEIAKLKWRIEFLAAPTSGTIVIRGKGSLPEKVEAVVWDVVWENPLASENETLQAIYTEFSQDELDRLATSVNKTAEQMMGEAIVLARELKKIGQP